LSKNLNPSSLDLRPLGGMILKQKDTLFLASYPLLHQQSSIHHQVHEDVGELD